MKFGSLSCFLLVLLFMNRASAQSDNGWTLDSCIHRAWASNVLINQASNNVGLSENTLKESKSGYLPSVNASYSNFLNYGRSIDPTSYQFVNGSVNNNNYSLSANIILFQGMRTPSRVNQSKIGLELAYGQLQEQKMNTALEVSNAYLTLLLSYEKLEIISEQLIASRNLQINTQKYIDNGLKSELDLLQVNSQISKEISDSVLAQNNLFIAKLTLMQLMEMSYSNDFEIKKVDPSLYNISFPVNTSETLFENAKVADPSINNALLTVQQNEYAIKVSQSAYYPTISLNTGLNSSYSSSNRKSNQSVVYEEEAIGYLDSNPSETVSGMRENVQYTYEDYPYFDQLSDNFNASISLQVNVPIFSKNQNKINVAKSTINLEQSKLTLKNQENILRKKIENDYLSQILLINQKTASENKMESYRLSYEKAKKQYDLNLISSYELLLEKNKLDGALSEIIQLKYQLLFQTVVLNYYQSGNIELPNKN